MIYHRQWQRDRKKYHLISQMSNSSLSATFSDSISQAYCLVSREEEEVKEGRRDEKKIKKKDIYIYIQKRKRTPRIINAYDQSTITSYFPRYRRSNQFCTVAEKQSTSQNPLPPKRCLSPFIRGVNIRRACLRLFSRIRYNHDPVWTHPRIVEEEKEKKRKGREETRWLRLVPHPLSFSPTSLSSFHLFHGPSTFFPVPKNYPFFFFFLFLHPFSYYPSLTFTFFCYRLRPVRDL